MNDYNEGGRFAVFFATWIVLAIVMFCIFFLNKDAKKKKKYFPYILVSVAALFVFFVIWISNGAFTPMLPIIIPFIGLIMFLNYRGTDFCESCGRTQFNQNPFIKAKFCKHCGNELNQSNKAVERNK